MSKSIWLSYDLGVKGDYSSLYAWLDNHKATECGDSFAFLPYEVADDEDLAIKLKQDLIEAVSFGKTDRIYVIWKSKDNVVHGKFIIGKRKASPWVGYGDSVNMDDTSMDDI